MSYPVKIYRKINSTYDLHVMWSIHNKCNYSCSYCPDELHNGSMAWLKLDDLKYFVDVLLGHYQNRLKFKNILFSFTGGEPTLWRDFKPFIQYLGEKNIRVGITTNGGISTNFWKGITHNFDYICLSFHTESADVDEFVDKYKFFHNEPDCVIPSVRVMMHKSPELWDKATTLIEKIKTFENYTLECVHILEDYGTGSKKISYDDPKKETFLEQNAFVEQYKNSQLIPHRNLGFQDYIVLNNDKKSETLQANDLINNDKVNFEGWECSIGIEQLFIHFSGSIKTSGCLMGEEIGNIRYADQIRFPEAPVICKTNSCFCPTDVRISKSKEPLGISYESLIGQKNKNPVVVGSSRYFKYRVYFDVDPKSLAGSAGALISMQLKRIVEEIKKTRNILADEFLMHINLLRDAHSIPHGKEIKNFIAELCKFDVRVSLKYFVTEDYDIDMYDNIENLFNVHLLVNEEKSLEVIDQKYDELIDQEIPIIRTIVLPNTAATERLFSAIRNIFSKTNRYFDVVFQSQYVLNYINRELTRSQMKPVESHHFCYKTLDDSNKIFTAARFRAEHLDYIDEEGVYGSVADLINTTHSAPSHKGWNCSIGAEWIGIKPNLGVVTSFCGQGESLGLLFDKNIIDKIKSLSCVVCEQNSCDHEIMQKQVFKYAKDYSDL